MKNCLASIVLFGFISMSSALSPVRAATPQEILTRGIGHAYMPCAPASNTNAEVVSFLQKKTSKIKSNTACISYIQYVQSLPSSNSLNQQLGVGSNQPIKIEFASQIPFYQQNNDMLNYISDSRIGGGSPITFLEGDAGVQQGTTPGIPDIKLIKELKCLDVDPGASSGVGSPDGPNMVCAQLRIENPFATNLLAEYAAQNPDKVNLPPDEKPKPGDKFADCINSPKDGKQYQCLPAGQTSITSNSATLYLEPVCKNSSNCSSTCKQSSENLICYVTSSIKPTIAVEKPIEPTPAKSNFKDTKITLETVNKPGHEGFRCRGAFDAEGTTAQTIIGGLSWVTNKAFSTLQSFAPFLSVPDSDTEGGSESELGKFISEALVSESQANEGISLGIKPDRIARNAKSCNQSLWCPGDYELGSFKDVQGRSIKGDDICVSSAEYNVGLYIEQKVQKKSIAGFLDPNNPDNEKILRAEKPTLASTSLTNVASSKCDYSTTENCAVNEYKEIIGMYIGNWKTENKTALKMLCYKSIPNSRDVVDILTKKFAQIKSGDGQFVAGSIIGYSNYGWNMYKLLDGDNKIIFPGETQGITKEEFLGNIEKHKIEGVHKIKQTQANQLYSCLKCANDGEYYSALGCFPVSNIDRFIQVFVFNFLMGLAGAFCLGCIIVCAFVIQTSGGDSARIQKAQGAIRNCIIGLVFIAFSVFIVRFVAVDLIKLQLSDVEAVSNK